MKNLRRVIGHDSPRKTAFLLALSLRLFLCLFFGFPMSYIAALPSGETVRHGDATFTRQGNNLIIKQNGQKLIVDWNSFSVEEGNLTRFEQPNKDAAALNRVTGGSRSIIDGRLEANGKVILINPAGVTVGPKGVVNVNSFTASTHDLTNQEFIGGGELLYKGTSQETVENHGVIRASGGDAVLIAKHVKNSGTVEAPNGIVALAGGTEVLVKPTGEERIFIKTGSEKGATVTQTTSGRIHAAAAEVKAAGNPYAAAINLDGLVSTKAVAANQSGKIKIDSGAGNVKIAKTTEVKSRKSDNSGGVIEVASLGDVEISGKLDAKGEVGKGGSIAVNAKKVTITPEAELAADGQTAGGSIAIASDAATGSTQVDGKLSATGTTGNGGEVKVRGNEIALGATAAIDASSAQANGGKITIGGEYQGGSNATDNAQNVTVASGAQINANGGATANGGNVVVWADGSTQFAGNISATGFNGGSAEVSGKQSLAMTGLADLRGNDAAGGKTGTLLLDPEDITLANIDPSNGTSFYSLATLASQLALAQVTITTNASLPGSGNIFWMDDFDWSAPFPAPLHSLTLNADNDFVLDGAITTGGNFTVNAGHDILLKNTLNVSGANIATLNADHNIDVLAQQNIGGGFFAYAGNDIHVNADITGVGTPIALPAGVAQIGLYADADGDLTGNLFIGRNGLSNPWVTSQRMGIELKGNNILVSGLAHVQGFAFVRGTATQHIYVGGSLASDYRVSLTADSDNLIAADGSHGSVIVGAVSTSASMGYDDLSLSFLSLAAPYHQVNSAYVGILASNNNPGSARLTINGYNILIQSGVTDQHVTVFGLNDTRLIAKNDLIVRARDADNSGVMLEVHRGDVLLKAGHDILFQGGALSSAGGIPILSGSGGTGQGSSASAYLDTDHTVIEAGNSLQIRGGSGMNAAAQIQVTRGTADIDAVNSMLLVGGGTGFSPAPNAGAARLLLFTDLANIHTGYLRIVSGTGTAGISGMSGALNIDVDTDVGIYSSYSDAEINTGTDTTSLTINIGGDLLIQSGGSQAQILSQSTDSTLNVGGNITLQGSTGGTGSAGTSNAFIGNGRTEENSFTINAGGDIQILGGYGDGGGAEIKTLVKTASVHADGSILVLGGGNDAMNGTNSVGAFASISNSFSQAGSSLDVSAGSNIFVLGGGGAGGTGNDAQIRAYTNIQAIGVGLLNIRAGTAPGNNNGSIFALNGGVGNAAYLGGDATTTKYRGNSLLVEAEGDVYLSNDITLSKVGSNGDPHPGDIVIRADSDLDGIGGVVAKSENFDHEGFDLTNFLATFTPTGTAVKSITIGATLGEVQLRSGHTLLHDNDDNVGGAIGTGVGTTDADVFLQGGFGNLKNSFWAISQFDNVSVTGFSHINVIGGNATPPGIPTGSVYAGNDLVLAAWNDINIRGTGQVHAGNDILLIVDEEGIGGDGTKAGDGWFRNYNNADGVISDNGHVILYAVNGPNDSVGGSMGATGPGTGASQVILGNLGNPSDPNYLPDFAPGGDLDAKYGVSYQGQDPTQAAEAASNEYAAGGGNANGGSGVWYKQLTVDPHSTATATDTDSSTDSSTSTSTATATATDTDSSTDSSTSTSTATATDTDTDSSTDSSTSTSTATATDTDTDSSTDSSTSTSTATATATDTGSSTDSSTSTSTATATATDTDSSTDSSTSTSTATATATDTDSSTDSSTSTSTATATATDTDSSTDSSTSTSTATATDTDTDSSTSTSTATATATDTDSSTDSSTSTSTATATATDTDSSTDSSTSTSTSTATATATDTDTDSSTDSSTSTSAATATATDTDSSTDSSTSTSTATATDTDTDSSTDSSTSTSTATATATDTDSSTDSSTSTSTATATATDTDSSTDSSTSTSTATATATDTDSSTDSSTSTSTATATATDTDSSTDSSTSTSTATATATDTDSSTDSSTSTSTATATATDTDSSTDSSTSTSTATATATDTDSSTEDAESRLKRASADAPELEQNDVQALAQQEQAAMDANSKFNRQKSFVIDFQRKEFLDRLPEWGIQKDAQVLFDLKTNRFFMQKESYMGESGSSRPNFEGISRM